MAFRILQGFLEERVGAFYREIQALAGFHSNYVCAASLISPFQGGTGFLKQKAKKGGGEVCRTERKGYFKIQLCWSITAAILIFAQLYAFMYNRPNETELLSKNWDNTYIGNKQFFIY